MVVITLAGRLIFVDFKNYDPQELTNRQRETNISNSTFTVKEYNGHEIVILQSGEDAIGMTHIPELCGKCK